MATTANGNGNLVDEFEESFQACLNVLTKDDTLHTMEKDEIKVEVDQSLLRFIDLARQMEAFFLQKRFLLSALKPELIVKEDVIDLRMELLRKEELIKRHYEKIAVWQNLLADLQGPRAQGPSLSGNNIPNAQQQPQQQQSAQTQHQVPQISQNAMVTLQQQQQQIQQQQQMQQHIQQQIQQQQMQQQVPAQMQQQQPPMGMACGGGTMNPQALFMQGGQRAAGSGGMVGVAGGFHHVLGGQGQSGAAGGLQGPLAYLEKTTSNIGMPEARR